MVVHRLILIGLVLLACVSPAFCLPPEYQEGQERAHKQDYAGYTALESDGIPWRFERKGRMVIIGDIHGDIDAFITILKDAKLIQLRGKKIEWIGGKDVQLVMMGDLIAKGDHSTDVLNLSMYLEQIMEEAGSEFHLILGNHELKALRGDFESFSEKELQSFKEVGGAKKLFSEEGAYGKWLSKKNSIIQIDDYIFFHKSLGAWIEHFTTGQVNATIRAWINFWLSEKDKPASSTKWTIGRKSEEDGIFTEDGPQYSNAMSPRTKSLNEKTMLAIDTLTHWMKKMGARFLFQAHYQMPFTKGPHPHYGNFAWLTDTGIARAIGGRIAYLDIPEDADPEKLMRLTRPRKQDPIRKRGCLAKLSEVIVASLTGN